MKILVRGTNWIGDAVMTIPALRRIRYAFPAAELTLGSLPWCSEVFGEADFIDDILTIDRSGNQFRSSVSEASTLKGKGFDLAVLFTNSFGTALTAKLAGIRRIAGYRNEARGFLLSDAFDKPAWKNERHESLYYLNLADRVIETFGGRRDDRDPDHSLPVSDERRRSGADLIRRECGESGSPTVVLGAGSQNSRAKRWPSENFATLASLIRDRLKARIVLLGSGKEHEVAARIVKLAGGEICDLTGRTDLSDAVAVLASADLLISNDMGLAHIAAAAGTPTITMFGPTDPRLTGPTGAEIIRNPVDCSPCHLRDCPIDHRCMQGINPEVVFRKALDLLQTD